MKKHLPPSAFWASGGKLGKGLDSLGEEAEQHTGGDGRADYAGNVGTHGVNEQVVARVVFEADVVGDAGRHGHGADAGIADERVDFLV